MHFVFTHTYLTSNRSLKLKQDGHDSPLLLHWLICKFLSDQTLKYLGIGLKHKTPKKD